MAPDRPTEPSSPSASGPAGAATPQARCRVAVTLEQSWHEVPGGTASAALGSIDALLAHGDPEGRVGFDLIGVAARHRADPPDPWKPAIEVRRLALPRL